MSKNRQEIEEAISRLTEEMKWVNCGSESYDAMANELERLMKAKSYEEDHKGLTPDVVFETIGRVADSALKVCGSLIMLGAVLSYEEKDVIAGKALGFVQKIRL